MKEWEKRISIGKEWREKRGEERRIEEGKKGEMNERMEKNYVDRKGMKEKRKECILRWGGGKKIEESVYWEREGKEESKKKKET